MNEDRIIIVLDSYEYIQKEDDLRKTIDNQFIPIFIYTQYENSLIQFFHRIPKIGSFLTHLSYWWISLIKAIIISIKYKKINRKLFINPIVAIFYSFFSRLLRRNDNITISGFLFENKNNHLYFQIRKWFVNYSFKKVFHIIVYSSAEVERYSYIFPKLSGKFVFIKYGRDYKYQDKVHFKYLSSYISSGGRSNRDFVTLCNAMRLLESKYNDLTCIIATRPECIDQIHVSKNTIIRYNIKLNNFGNFIAESKFFILPIINTNLSAGHMALMEAMSLGKIILCADVPSIRDYVDEKYVIFYASEMASDMANKISFIVENIDRKDVTEMAKQVKYLYENEYTFNSFLLRIIQYL